jgi:diguanylate cyclase (GGDEF)-like protein/PAS domain S-box-containing protein
MAPVDLKVSSPTVDGRGTAAFPPRLSVTPSDTLVADRILVGRTLALLYLLGAGIVMAWIAMPHPASSDDAGVAVCAALAIAIGGLLLRGLPERAPRPALHVVIGAATVLISLLLHFAAVPGTGFALLYVWSTPYAYAYLSLRAALAHTALVAGGFAAVTVTKVDGGYWGIAIDRLALVAGSVLIIGLLVRRITQRVRASDGRFRRAFETSLNGMALLNADGTITQANGALVEILGRGQETLVGASMISFAHPDEQEHCRSIIAETISGGDSARFSKRFVRADGAIIWARVATALIRSGDGTPRYFFTQLQDVTGEELARQRLDQQVREQEAIAALSSQALESSDPEALTRAAIRLVTGMAGPAAAARLGEDPASWKLQTAVGDGADGEGEGEARFLQAIAHVVTTALERIDAEARTRHMALHDDLTGQPNRALLLDRLQQALARSQRGGGGVAVLLIDLDGFKHLNDSFGHHVGDELLQALAPRLAAAVRPSDTLARLGGDEFVVLCEDVDDARQAIRLARRLRQAWEGHFDLSRGEVFITASTGISFCLGGRQTAASMLREADAAMYRAKERGPDQLELFDEVLRARAMHRLRVENEFRRAIERGELRLHYQPCFDVATGAIVGVEALMRWQHPDRGLLGPGEFIAVAEESGLIVQAGRWALAEAARQVASWQRTIPGAELLGVSVNVSARQLGGGNLRVDVADVLAESGLAPNTLGLEITESVLMEGSDWPAAAEDLRRLGTTLLLDDFGTGYSSLSYLKRLSLDVVKIDRSFIDGLGSDPDDSAIVAAIVSLARTLGLTVVGEGVETEQQLTELRRLGCEVVQGFLLSSPLPAAGLERLLRRSEAA